MMYNNVFMLIPHGDLITGQAGNVRAFVPGDSYSSSVNIAGETKKALEGGTLAYSPESVAGQKASWDVINTFENVRDHIKRVVRKHPGYSRIYIKAPGLKRVDDSSVLSATDRVIRNTLPAALKSGYLETTDPQWFCWKYDSDKNTFIPEGTNGGDKSCAPDGVYVIKDDNLRANSCITASRLLSWMNQIEDAFMKEVGGAMAQLGESCPYFEGWAMSFVSDGPNNLFDRKYQSRRYLPPTANSRLTVVGTENTLQLLKDFLTARKLPTDFKYRVIKDDLLEKNTGEEELGAIFAGEVAQDALPYGLFMYPAWVTVTGSAYTSRRSWSMLKHWIRLPLSSAVDKSDAYYKVLRSVACYGAMPSVLGGYLIATSAGFFHVDDLQKPQVVSYRTLEELNLMEGFPTCKQISPASIFANGYFGGANNVMRYLSGARAYYFKKHPLEQYGKVEKFIDLKKHSNLLETTFPSSKLQNMSIPSGAFDGTCVKKGNDWNPYLFTQDARFITITSYLQDIMYEMFHHEQAVFFKGEKFVNSYTDNFNPYMNGLFKEGVLCDAFVIKLGAEYLTKAGFKEKAYKPFAMYQLYGAWYFPISRSF